jgi:hypothetical protein
MNKKFLNKFLVVDNLLTKEQQDYFENIVLNIPWYFNTTTSDYRSKYFNYFKNDKNVIENIQFTHLFFKDGKINSDYYNDVYNLLKIFFKNKDIKENNIIKIKSNLQTQEKNSFEENYTTPHTDYDYKHYVLLYYVNDSDGDTFIFKKDNNILKKIKPKKGRFLFFDGNLLHASSSPIISKYRIVVNFNIKIF